MDDAASRPLGTSHKRVEPSEPAVAKYLPSGLRAILVTAPPFAMGGATFSPLGTSHRWAALSVFVARYLPSELNATFDTKYSWMMGGAASRPLGTSQSRAVLSSLAVARYLPLGLKATRLILPSCSM